MENGGYAEKRTHTVTEGRIRGMIFDVDGTLLDSMPIWQDVGKRYLRSRDIAFPDNLVEILFPMSLPEAAEYFIHELGVQESAEEIIAGVLKIVEDFYLYEAPLKDGAEEYLIRMRERGVRMLIATSGNRRLVERAFERLHISSFFEGILTCEEAGAGKQYPDIYLKAAEILGTEPGETEVYEDVLHAVETAKRAGFSATAIYDAASAKNWEKIRTAAERAVLSWRELL